MKFIGVKIIEATPMTAVEFSKKNNKPASLDINKLRYEDPGYEVVYGDGYCAWSPKDVFESAYFPMINSDGTKITQEMVDAFIGEVKSETIDEKTTHVKVNTITGFVQHEVSSCVDPKNYDLKIGTEIATKRIKDTIWKCLGFVLQWGQCGLK